MRSSTTRALAVAVAVAVAVLMIKKRGGRKLVIAPSGADAWALPRASIDNTIEDARPRHRWKKLLDSGSYPTV